MKVEDRNWKGGSVVEGQSSKRPGEVMGKETWGSGSRVHADRCLVTARHVCPSKAAPSSSSIRYLQQWLPPEALPYLAIHHVTVPQVWLTTGIGIGNLRHYGQLGYGTATSSDAASPSLICARMKNRHSSHWRGGIGGATQKTVQLAGQAEACAVR